jgi:A/G-specific adenine glycosylase
MKANKNPKAYFSANLNSWHTTANHRSLPWKNVKDPYKIWLSEVILQQTRALQGLPYYDKFTEAFPTVQDMAAAKDEDVFRIWQGLGYYNRCKNMLATARHITNELLGVFPDTYEELLGLKGIGPYTAAAIASFAYGLPHAVVDGNVYRVLSRYFGIETPFDTTEGKREFAVLASELLDKSASAAHNQAIMDLGATVCTPQNPACDSCPLAKKCVALANNLTGVLPVRSKKVAVRKRYFHYLLLKKEDTIWISKRTGKDIWQNLHEPYLIEADSPLTVAELAKHELFKKLNIAPGKIRPAGNNTQKLTHQLIDSRFFNININEKNTMIVDGGQWLKNKELKKIAFPKTVLSFLENNFYF